MNDNALRVLKADMVILHPKIYTVARSVDEIRAGQHDFPIIENGGVAVQDGKIVFVGAADDAQGFVGPDTEIIDASGQVLMPGLCDSHIHAIEGSIYQQFLDVAGIGREAMYEKVISHAKELPEGEIVVAMGWNEQEWDDNTFPSRHEVDEIISDRPCILYHISGHLAVGNSAALALTGITEDAPDPEGGRIGHYEDGSLDGLLYDSAIQHYSGLSFDALSLEALGDAAESICHMLNSMGITSVIDPNHHPTQARGYVEALRRNSLTLRVSIMHFIDNDATPLDEKLRRLEERFCITDFGGDMLKMNGVKLIQDGIPAAMTASMREPYKDDPSTKGMSVWSQEDLNAIVSRANELGWQFGIHTIGDNASDMVLEAFEQANKVHPVQDRRHYLIHYAFPHSDQWETMKRLNISATMQPSIPAEMGEAKFLTTELADINQAAGPLFAAGILCGGSSDFPAANPNPFDGMYYAVTREDAVNGGTFCEEGRVTPEEALIMYTKYSAYLAGDDDRMGSIEPGMLADMVLVDKDFLAGSPDDIRQTKVQRTIVNGRTAFLA